MHKPRLPLALALCVALLAGCGWHPRGAPETAGAISALRVQGESPDSEIALQLGRSLRAAGIDTVDTQGAPTLHIGREEQRMRNVALDRNGRPAEQEMQLLVSFELRNAEGTTVLGPEQLSATRIIAYDPNAVIAKNEERRIIRHELRERLVAQLFRQLRRVDAQMLKAAPATP